MVKIKNFYYTSKIGENEHAFVPIYTARPSMKVPRLNAGSNDTIHGIECAGWERHSGHHNKKKVHTENIFK